MFRKLKESLNMLSKDMEDKNKTKSKLLEIKTTESEMKNILNGIRSRIHKKNTVNLKI